MTQNTPANPQRGSVSAEERGGETPFPKRGGPGARITGGGRPAERLGMKLIRSRSPGVGGRGGPGGLHGGWGGSERGRERRNKILGMVV